MAATVSEQANGAKTKASYGNTCTGKGNNRTSSVQPKVAKTTNSVAAATFVFMNTYVVVFASFAWTETATDIVQISAQTWEESSIADPGIADHNKRLSLKLSF